MSVKEVLQSLVDDSLVDTEKIGTSVYFWSYPSKAMHTVRNNIELYHLTFYNCRGAESYKLKHVLSIQS